MSLTTLDPNAALIVIDLQKGIVNGLLEERIAVRCQPDEAKLGLPVGQCRCIRPGL